jgi:hypothetical protein
VERSKAAADAASKKRIETFSFDKGSKDVRRPWRQSLATRMTLDQRV